MNKIYEDNVGTLYLEINSGHPIIHCDIRKWSKGIYDHCFKVWSELLLQLKEKGFNHLLAPIDPEDRKLKKFATMFGMEKTEIQTLCKDGKIREVWSIECHKQHQ